MQFNTETDEQDIISDITFLLSGVSETNYALKDRTRNVNERFKMVWQMIFEAFGGWQFQDDNLSLDPYADQTLTASTGTYALPTGHLTVNMVEIKNSGGTYEKLDPLTLKEFKRMGGDAAFVSEGVPRYYMLYEDTIKLLPTPNYTVATTGIRIYFDQGIDIFESTDTDVVPGFASPFHRMLSVGAALDYAIAKGLKGKITDLQNLWNDYERRLRAFYSKRWQDREPKRINPSPDLVNEFR